MNPTPPESGEQPVAPESIPYAQAICLARTLLLKNALNNGALDEEAWRDLESHLRRHLSAPPAPSGAEPVAWETAEGFVVREDLRTRFAWKGAYVGFGRAIPASWRPALYAAPLPDPQRSEPLKDEPLVGRDAVWLIHFDDRDRGPEILTTEDAARERFRQISQNWNAHLFVKVASNSRDDRFASANATIAADQRSREGEPTAEDLCATCPKRTQSIGLCQLCYHRAPPAAEVAEPSEDTPLETTEREAREL